ncbi:hypothetical protein Taro_053268 [Colocasia esculenta]|uniref:Uncharacterized protein n=1 Tax=Colocasia esculenta TaxID=4460 RepID=A0A843XMB2_COLES|nr:hypothetical protein [Colocasia esculenta]
MQETVAGLTQALQNVVQAGTQAGARNGAGDLQHNFRSLGKGNTVADGLIRNPIAKESYVQSLSNNSGFHYPRVQSPSRTLTHPATTGLLFTTRRGIQHPRSHQQIVMSKSL